MNDGSIVRVEQVENNREELSYGDSESRDEREYFDELACLREKAKE